MGRCHKTIEFEKYVKHNIKENGGSANHKSGLTEWWRQYIYALLISHCAHSTFKPKYMPALIKLGTNFIKNAHILNRTTLTCRLGSNLYCPNISLYYHESITIAQIAKTIADQRHKLGQACMPNPIQRIPVEVVTNRNCCENSLSLSGSRYDVVNCMVQCSC